MKTVRTVDDGKVVRFRPNTRAVDEDVPLVPRHLQSFLLQHPLLVQYATEAVRAGPHPAIRLPRRDQLATC